MIGGARNTLLVTPHPFLVTLLHHLMSGSQLHRLMSGRMGGGLISGRRRKRVTGTHPDTGALCNMAALVPTATSYISGWKGKGGRAEELMKQGCACIAVSINMLQIVV